MKFKTSGKSATPISPRQQLNNQYNTARYNLVLALALTLLNIVVLLTGGDSYWLFSAFLPYYMVLDGVICCGKMPQEYYEYDGYTMADYEFFPESYLIARVIIAVVILAALALCFFMSKKLKSGWLIGALVIFGIDSAALLMLGDLSGSVLDILFHIWVVVYLVLGIRAASKLKNMPEEESVPALDVENAGAELGEESPNLSSETPAEEQSTEEPDAWAQLRQDTDNTRQ